MRKFNVRIYCGADRNVQPEKWADMSLLIGGHDKIALPALVDAIERFLAIEMATKNEFRIVIAGEVEEFTPPT